MCKPVCLHQVSLFPLLFLLFNPFLILQRIAFALMPCSPATAKMQVALMHVDIAWASTRRSDLQDSSDMPTELTELS